MGVQPVRISKGSVKTFEVFEEPTSERLGKGRMTFRPSYSIFDLKKFLDDIPGRESICIIAAYDFELLENNGINTHYLGVDLDDKPVSLDKMYDRGIAPTKMWVEVAQVFYPKFMVVDGKPNFSYEYFEKTRGKLNNFVVPLECIYRNGLPKGSSILRELEEARKRGDVKFINRLLGKLGLTQFPKPNTMLPKQYGNFDTKYEPLGDRRVGDDYDIRKAFETYDYNLSEAVRISGLTFEQFLDLIETRNKIAGIIKKRGAEVGITPWDGKCEFVWSHGPMAADVVGGPDEDRWFYEGQQVSKEILRQIYDIIQPELRADIKRAQNEALQESISTGLLRDWREFLTVYPKSLKGVSPYLIPLVGEMHLALANQLTDKQWYDVRPLGTVMKELTQVNQEIINQYRR
jgi:phosphoribosylaminoimidazole-succinocarboxamide synthase